MDKINVHVACLLSGLLLALTMPSTSAAPVKVPGTRVTLDPPPGFTLARDYPGFTDNSTGASIIIMEGPFPFAEATKGFTPALLARKPGSDFISSETVRLSGLMGYLVVTRQQAHGETFLKQVGLTGDASHTLMINTNCLVGSSPAYVAGIRRAIHSASWGLPSEANMLEGLNFSIDPGSVMEIGNRLSNALLLREKGRTGPATGGKPTLIVAPSLGPEPIPDVKAFAEAQIKDTKTVKNVTNLQGAAFSAGGLKGYEVVADALEEATGTPLKVYFVVLVHDAGYYLFSGYVAADRADKFIPEFRRIASTLRRVDPAKPVAATPAARPVTPGAPAR